MLTGKPLVLEEKATDDGTMLSWLIAMSGGHIAPELSLKSKLRAEYFDENSTGILPTFSKLFILYRIVQT